MTNSEETPSYRWVVLGTFTLNYSLVIIAVVTLGLLLPEISDELDLSPSQQGWLASSILFSNLLFGLPFNWGLSRYRPWRVASISFVAGTLFIAFNGWAPTFAVLILARIGLGLAYMASQAPQTLLILQWMPRRQFGMANGILFSALDCLMGVGYIIIPLIMILVGGWRNTLYAWAAVTMMASLLWIILGRERITLEYQKRMKAQAGMILGNVLKYREVWYVGLAVFGTMVSRIAFSSFWPTFAQDEYAISVTTVGFVMGLIAFGMAPTELLITVIPYFSRRKSMVLIVCGITQVLVYLGLLSTSSLPLLFLLSILSGMAFGFWPVLITILYELPGIKPREVVMASGFMYTLLWAGGAIGPLLVGFAQETTGSLKEALVITCFAPLTLVVAGILLAGHGKREAASKLSAELKEHPKGT